MLPIQKMEKQNVDFQVTQYFFIEMKYYTIQNHLKKCRHVGFCDLIYRSC